MSVLIVDRSSVHREAAAELVRWADGRIKIFSAQTGKEAWNFGLKANPSLVICELKLSDTSGMALCMKLRERLPHATLVAYTNDNPVPAPFDGSLNKPPTRINVLAWLNRARQRFRVSERAAVFGDEASPLRERRQRSPAINIHVCLIEQQDMKFTVGVPKTASIAEVLTQLGKDRIGHFCLIRGGEEIGATPDTRVQEEDLLMLRL